eukprot:3893457-Karenia_brevis.AAC.1
MEHCNLDGLAALILQSKVLIKTFGHLAYLITGQLANAWNSEIPHCCVHLSNFKHEISMWDKDYIRMMFRSLQSADRDARRGQFTSPLTQLCSAKTL